MPKQPVNINFASGINTKVDPWQLPIGQFERLKNSVFDVGGLMKKRPGYGQLADLPNSTYNYLTTFKQNLTAIGTDIAAYNEFSRTWISKGTIQPMKVSVDAVIRNNLNQTQVDSALTESGLMCVVYCELNDSTTTRKYAIVDSITGQNIVAPQAIPVASGVVSGSARVFLLGSYFVIVFTNVISGTSHLQYISISTADPSIVTANHDLAAAYISAATLSWDGVVFNDHLYVAYNTTSGGQAIKITSLSAPQAALGGNPATATTFASQICTIMSLSVDSTVSIPLIYLSYYDLSGSTGYVAAVDSNLAKILNPTQIIASGTYLNLASAAHNGSVTVFEEAANNYSYDSGTPTHFIRKVSVTSAGSVGSTVVSIRSVGLGSKAFILNDIIYYLAAYQSPYQSTYFLINGTTSLASAPVIVGKIAYENGNGYLTIGLPNATVYGTKVQIPYLIKDLIQPITVDNNSSQTATVPIYAQTGINLAGFDLTTDGICTAEAGNNLHLSGGFLGMYDGYLPVEHNFFLWPDSVELTTATTGGSLADQQYAYQVIYEWADNQGNIHQSAASVPVFITTTGGGTSAVTVNVPYLRLTMKTANPLKIVIYRWSVGQPVYHQVTSITAPSLNSTTTDSLAFVDILADSAIQGNSIIYTTGGVVEDIGAPASNIMALFDSRLWLVDAEDPNLLWYSKQVIEAVPVEMSDLLTYFVSPNIGTTPSTGPVTALAPMDDKLIVFKQNSIFYINGTGPDNTGSNSQYSQPIFITSTVGSINQVSIVLMNEGLMFDSDKGRWLLNRGLQVAYIGAAVERYNDSPVNSANNIPGKNQIRLTIDSGQTLLYDYYYQQWGTFEGAAATSSTLYQAKHTYINQYAQTFQETPDRFLDGSNPVLMGFTTGWINLAALQGFQRFYGFYLAGKYYSPHKLLIQVYYNYNDSPSQNVVITPRNFSAIADSPFGTPPAPFGSPVNLEQWRIDAKIQKCQSFKISVDEVYDPSFGVAAGAGLTISGINMIVLVKKATRPIRAADSAGLR